MTPKQYIMVAALVVAFFAGWMGNGWRLNSKEQKSTAKTLVDLQDRMETQVNEMEKFNSTTAASELEMLNSIRTSLTELRGIRDEIAASNVGRCSITPDGDRLRDETYRAAVPAGDVR